MELAVAYQDEGKFRCIFFTEVGGIIDELDVMDILDINAESVGMDGIYQPCTTVVFLPDGNSCISVFHRMQRKHYQFIYDFKNKQIVGKLYNVELESITSRNFPVKSFFSHSTKTVVTFYRIGYCVTYTSES